MEYIEQEFINFYQRIAKNIGLDNITSILFAKLYLEPDEISMEELASQTGFSLASISNKIKLLDAMGLITKSTKPGSKKIYLFMEKNFKKLMIQHFRKKQELIFKPAKEKIPEIIKNAKVKNKIEKQKLNILKNYLTQIIELEENMKLMIENLTDDN